MYKVVFLIFAIFAAQATAFSASPYSGEEHRAIKSLSAQEVESLRRGDGMGFAKLAELNHFPGPKHVLELSVELKLSESQLSATNALYDQMNKSAVAIGEQLIDAEARLDQDFAAGNISAEKLRASLSEIQGLRSELRYIHLEAHLRQKQLLSKEQVRHYDVLRGYHDGANAHHEHGTHHNDAKMPQDN